jgi:hypothetical protein
MQPQYDDGSSIGYLTDDDGMDPNHTEKPSREQRAFDPLRRRLGSFF